jgi:hypothetical protein
MIFMFYVGATLAVALVWLPFYIYDKIIFLLCVMNSTKGKGDRKGRTLPFFRYCKKLVH